MQVSKLLESKDWSTELNANKSTADTAPVLSLVAIVLISVYVNDVASVYNPLIECNVTELAGGGCTRRYLTITEDLRRKGDITSSKNDTKNRFWREPDLRPEVNTFYGNGMSPFFLDLNMLRCTGSH